MMTINALRCPRNVGVVANNKRLNASSSNRCSGTSSTIKNNTNDSRRRKGVVISSFGEALKSLFISLFFFFLVLASFSGKKKTFEFSPLVCSSSSSSPRRRFGAFSRARAQTTSTSTALRYRHRPRSRIDLRGVLRARAREIFSHKRENKTAEGRGEKVFLLSFLSFSFCFLQNQSKKTGVEDPSCGSESVAVKKGGRKGGENFFFVLTFILSLFSRTYKNRE